MIAPDAQYVTALILLGAAWAFVRADSASGSSRALALALGMAGVSIIMNAVLIAMARAGPLPAAAGYLVAPEVLAFCAAFEWVRRVRHTIPAGELRTRFGDGVLRFAQALAVLYGINSVRHPDLRIRNIFGGLDGPAVWSAEVIRLFAAPLMLALLLWMLSIVLCMNRNPEPAERVRLVSFLVAVPVMVSGFLLPLTVAPITTVLGLTILLGGALKHAQLKGSQGQFLSRFLSPQVAELVNRDGLRGAMREQRRELSVVCADLRRFTAFAGAHSSEDVIALLREYYDTVGAAVLEFEGTIKDYAGDGVLILIGAPVTVDDHAARAVELAQQIRALLAPVLARWSDPGHALGLGIGVASGSVTVGVIGGEGRLEYAAVGRAVNLAARLCEQAADGEILIAEDTVSRLDGHAAAHCEARASLPLKGFTDPVTHFALAAGSARA